MKKAVLVSVVLLLISVSLVSCKYSSSVYKPPSGLLTRVAVSEGVTASFAFGGVVVVNGQNDTRPRVAELSAGTAPGLMAISPTRNLLAAFDSASNTVFGFDTVRESALGNVRLPGPTSSMALPTADPIGYAAVPTATINGFSILGAVEVMNIASGGITTTIGVTNAQTVISNSTGSQLLVFSNDSNSVTVLAPSNAQPLVDTSCYGSQPNTVCTIVPGFDRPVFAIISADDSTAYIFNCGAECGGTQASIQTLDLTATPPTPGTPILVNGATYGFLKGQTLYVAGKGTPTGPLCTSIASAAVTAATYCGTLDIVDLGAMTDPYYNSPSTEIAVTDGTQNRMDLSPNGQLFVGARNCTDVGDVNNSSGEVRGCLAIYNTLTGAVVIPPDNGNVDGLQSFSTRNIEYVAEGGNLRVYDTTKDILLINDFIPAGTVIVVGYVGDAKAVDFF